MKTILTYGTYDVLHYGHIRLLKRAKALGDKLIVAISTDEFNEIKVKKSFYNYEQRKEILEEIKYVDMIIPEKDWNQKEDDIKKYNVDVVVMGSDWQGDERFEKLKSLCEVIYLPRTDNVCSTTTREFLNNIGKIMH